MLFHIMQLHIFKTRFNDLLFDDLIETGQIFAWGLCMHRQLGTPLENTETASYIATPTLVEALQRKKVRGIYAGAHHSAAVTGNFLRKIS
jgi:alpha-tubulin suppressor-like RCC1 family protein